MYVRDAKNREEVWLLDHIEAMSLDDSAFRSRDYVVAIDEESGEKAGFGRIRIHKLDDGSELCELTSIGVLEGWQRQGVGAHVIERLLTHAGDQGFDLVYTIVNVPDYFAQFGFEPIDVDELPSKLAERYEAKRERLDGQIVPMTIEIEDFSVPERLREAFKRAPESRREDEADATDAAEIAEEFGIDPETATYKYDTGGKSQ